MAKKAGGSTGRGNFQTPVIELHKAAKANRADEVERLLENGEDANIEADRGWTALQIAARQGNDRIVQLLLGYGANVNAANIYGDTALHQTCAFGKTSCAQILLARGADHGARNKDGDTPLHRACFHGKTDCVRILLFSGVSIETKNKKRQTPRDLASNSKKGKAEMIRLLGTAGLRDVGITDVDNTDYRPPTELYARGAEEYLGLPERNVLPATAVYSKVETDRSRRITDDQVGGCQAEWVGDDYGRFEGYEATVPKTPSKSYEPIRYNTRSTSSGAEKEKTQKSETLVKSPVEPMPSQTPPELQLVSRVPEVVYSAQFGDESGGHGPAANKPAFLFPDSDDENDESTQLKTPAVAERSATVSKKFSDEILTAGSRASPGHTEYTEQKVGTSSRTTKPAASFKSKTSKELATVDALSDRVQLQEEKLRYLEEQMEIKDEEIHTLKGQLRRISQGPLSDCRLLLVSDRDEFKGKWWTIGKELGVDEGQMREWTEKPKRLALFNVLQSWRDQDDEDDDEDDDGKEEELKRAFSKCVPKLKKTESD